MKETNELQNYPQTGRRIPPQLRDGNASKINGLRRGPDPAIHRGMSHTPTTEEPMMTELTNPRYPIFDSLPVGSHVGEVDECAVRSLLADSLTLSATERSTIATTLERMIRRRERCTLGTEYVSLSTMAETARRLRAGA